MKCDEKSVLIGRFWDFFLFQFFLIQQLFIL